MALFLVGNPNGGDVDPIRGDMTLLWRNPVQLDESVDIGLRGREDERSLPA